MIVFSAILVLTVISVYTFFRKIDASRKPSLLAWFIIAVTAAISLGSYLAHAEFSDEGIVRGALFFANSGASIAIFMRLLYLGGYNLRLSTFDKVSGIAACLIIPYWFVSADSFGANLSTQGLMVISYVLITKRVIESRGKSDDSRFWVLAFLMSILSVVSIWDGEVLEGVNTIRSIFSTGIVLGTIYYYRVRYH